MLHPTISIIIPTRNMGARLGLVLHAFIQQDYSMEDVEIMVIDNGSTDDSVQIAQKYPVSLYTIPHPPNPYICRNLGIRQAQSEFILLADASCIPATDYISELIKVQLQNEADLVVANVQFDVSARSSLGEIVDSLHFTRNHEYLGVRKTFPGCALLFRRSLIDRVGSFNEEMRSGADFVWTEKAYDKDIRISYAANARVMRSGVPFPRLLRKAHRLGWGHGTIARSKGKYSFLGTILRMRPPGIHYMQYVLQTRGEGEFDQMRIRIWFGLWFFRIAYNIGRMHLWRALSD